MDAPQIAARTPTVLELEPGDYWWCGCGLSKQPPFCDGAHKGSGFGPEKLTVEERFTFALCNCKTSGNKPLCDGSHSQLPQ